MSSFSLGFGAASQYQGNGAGVSLPIYGSFPPEAGCMGMQAEEALIVHAKVTDLARRYLSRALTDGTAFQITKFAVGLGGYNTAFPIFALPVDPTLEHLDAEVYRDTVDLVETPSTTGVAKSFVCRLNKDDIRAGIGEIGLIAEILDSPYATEIGTTFLFAKVHQPLNSKTFSHVQTYRVVIVF
jgi:hypothetical protein